MRWQLKIFEVEFSWLWNLFSNFTNSVVFVIKFIVEKSAENGGEKFNCQCNYRQEKSSPPDDKRPGLQGKTIEKLPQLQHFANWKDFTSREDFGTVSSESSSRLVVAKMSSCSVLFSKDMRDLWQRIAQKPAHFHPVVKALDEFSGK